PYFPDISAGSAPQMTSWRMVLMIWASAWLVSHPANAANRQGQSSNAEGQALAAELRSARPTENLQIRGVLKIRDADGKRTTVPVRYRFSYSERSWQNIYETEAIGRVPAEKLVVVHTEDQPNRYLHSRADGIHNPPAAPVVL